MDNKYDVFISYRRDGGSEMARLIYLMLEYEGYNTFFDHESIRQGKFDEVIDKAISECTDFIVILSPHMFDNRNPHQDEVIKEIVLAKQYNKNIIPIMMKGFEYPNISYFPESISQFPKVNALNIDISIFEFKRLKEFMTSEPSKYKDILSNVLHNSFKDMNLFKKLDEETREQNMKALLRSYLSESNTKMVHEMIRPYLGQAFNEKRDFEYTLTLFDDQSISDKLGFNNPYFLLNERLSFTKKIYNNEGMKDFWVVFDFTTQSLDSHLRKDNVLFSESLKLKVEDIEKLKSYSDKIDHIYKNILKCNVAIDNERLIPEVVELTEEGICARYVMKEIKNDFRFICKFDIPFDIVTNQLQVSISEPTYNPHILFRYDDIFEVNMIPFFDNTINVKNSNLMDNEYDILSQNKWVMPMSGAVFCITEKQDIQNTQIFN